MTQLVGQGLDLVRRGQLRADPDPPQGMGAVPVAPAPEGRELDLEAELPGAGQQGPEVLAGSAERPHRGGQVPALGLLQVEDVGHAEADQLRSLVLVLVRDCPQAGGEDADGLLAPAHLATQAPPGLVAGHPAGSGALAQDQYLVLEAVVAEVAAGPEPGGPGGRGGERQDTLPEPVQELPPGPRAALRGPSPAGRRAHGRLVRPAPDAGDPGPRAATVLGSNGLRGAPPQPAEVAEPAPIRGPRPSEAASCRPSSSCSAAMR